MMNFLQTILALAVAAAIIIGLLTFIGLLAKFQCYRTIKQVESGKMSDATLMRRYNMTKKYKDSVFWTFFNYGIYYKYGKKLNQKVFEVFKECMIKRNLPL
ncbi:MULTISPECIES: hypothetical protein [unclassified Gilliamella]|uniref:hypothetical protein n=1 Tax=unclassified Gilliamella TaxID=2685620 RepID=UPI00080DA6C2|nr:MULTISPECIES: hypothetical protein [Gilliamella]MCX8640973.1 hypothetical protein [Gilliamella sp. B3835]MCX8707912.1 hypothetical protein [Gilliamella sp. B3783]MCX8710251.1 hypothetical protein [Gilliamella sp. B3780]MCX8712469.1 hypothetical protein [Gilliamella sp. B3468]MCX8714892.1 hypothetical protein [Gilliamella sp. B3781]